MHDDLLTAAFATLDGDVEPRPEFAAALLARMETELHEPVAAKALRPRRSRRRWSLVPAVAIAAATALVVVGVVSVTPERVSALNVIQSARAHFAALPPVHVIYTVRADNDTNHPSLESVSTNELWYAGPTRWRLDVVASNTTAAGRPGEFRVADGTLQAHYTKLPGLFEVGRLSDIDGPPVWDVSPQTVWLASGRHGMSPDAWFRSRCSTRPETFLGRAASRLTCDNNRLSVWVDKETGLMLKVVDRGYATGLVREVTRLDLRPRFPAGLFTLKPPAGAVVQWAGSPPIPAPYATHVGRAVVATVRLRGTDPMSLGATDDAVWAVTTIGSGEHTSWLLQRVDASTNRVTTTVHTTRSIQALLYVDGVLWGAAPYGPPGQGSSVVPLDPVTGQPVGRPIVTDPVGGAGAMGLATTPGYLWYSGGRQSTVTSPEGLSWSRFALARIDLRSHAVTTFTLRGSASRIAAGFGSVWVNEETTKDRSRIVESLSRLDPATGRVIARFPLTDKGGPSIVTVGDRYVYVSPPTGDYTGLVVAIDPATNRVVARRSLVGRITWTAGGLWAADGLHGYVLRLDPSTLRTVARVRVGRGPNWMVTTPGALWVMNWVDPTLARIAPDAVR